MGKMTENRVSFENVKPALVTASIHSSHAVRDELEPLLALTGEERLREEDPYTDLFGDFAAARIKGNKSRFEIDLNRTREKAVYLSPEDAWGLKVWKSEPALEIVERSLNEYDQFYLAAGEFLKRVASEKHPVILLDIHSYNHRRLGPGAPVDDPALNPEINIGTGTMRDRDQWADIVECCTRSLREYDFLGRHLDVRENVRFKGGWFPQWIHRNFPDTVCCLSLEVKKFFMDEWTGQPDWQQIEAVRFMFKSAADDLLGMY
jgi:N-formylglutamate amidohydrolase